MRTFMPPLALIATLGTAGAALSNTAAGTIADVCAITGDVTLENGMEFRFSDEDAGRHDHFKPGDAVSIDWIAVGDRMEGRQISPTGGTSNTLTGVVAEASDITGQLTLTDGTTLDVTDDAGASLDTFGPGDTVSVHYITIGDDIRGLSVSPSGTSANIATGMILELNDATGNVVFANGAQYDLSGMDDETLDSFSVGDRVAVHYLTQGDAKVALSISPGT